MEELAEQFFTRIQGGEQLTVDTFVAEYPDHKNMLNDFIEAMLLVREVKTSIQSGDELEVGAGLGPYRILEKIGRGGMGTVYAAKDTRLDRKIAIKLLLSSYADDAEWLERFHREARLASSLNHPNVLTIHEVGNEQGSPFMATEYVDGITLLEVLKTEPISHGQAIGYAIQIASAITAAHGAGIVHRDLKPENVMVRRDGIVKVLDFGLAKVTRNQSSVAGEQTRTTPGVVLGTVHYMSPEQARGLPVQMSSDIFSFGILLYFLCWGTHPFAGETSGDVMAAIINQDPHPFPNSRIELPASLEQVVSNCLKKQPELRPRAVDLLASLQGISLKLGKSATQDESQVSSNREVGVATAKQISSSASTKLANVCYARSGNVNIAWQTLGDGPIDLVFVMGWVSHLEWFWKEPSFAAFLQRLATFSRVILFDKRGTGLSDKVPVQELPTLEQRMDDVRAVMEAANSQRAVLCGVSEGGPMCTLFAATYPEKTIALTMIGCYARRLWAEDYPWGPTAEQREVFLKDIERNWGGPLGIEDRAPNKSDDPEFRDWWSSYLRMGASPGAAVALTRMNAQIDVRPILSTIQVPTLVLHRTGDRCLRVEEGRYLASKIPAAKFVELPGDDHLPFVGDAAEILDEIEEFLTGMRHAHQLDHVLTTALCIHVESLTASDSGESASSKFERFASMVERELALFHGDNFTVNGNCLFLTFDGPARAVRAARAITGLAARSLIVVRCGVHTDICAIGGDQVRGPAIAISKALAEGTSDGEILVTGAVRDLVSGSGLEFDPQSKSGDFTSVDRPVFRLKS